VTVVVVCTANIARSPLAEAMLRTHVGEDQITWSSAGTHAREGSIAADGSVALARARGLDLGEHRSRVVTPRMVQDADLMVTMSERQRGVCATMVGGAGARCFTFRELVRLTNGLDHDDHADAPADAADRLSWLVGRAHLARPAAVPATAPEDVADPYGRDWDRWLTMGQDLDELVDALRELTAR
jgi:protein-tyrosine phosphatase